MAPEQFHDDRYDSKVDVYSFGIVLFEMLCETIPYLGLEIVEVAYAKMSGICPKLPRDHPQVADLIRQCWSNDPDERPTFDEIYNEMIRGRYLWEGTNSKAVGAIQKLIADATTKARPRRANDGDRRDAREHHHRDPSPKRRESAEHHHRDPSPKKKDADNRDRHRDRDEPKRRESTDHRHRDPSPRREHSHRDPSPRKSGDRNHGKR
jgi:serine/threonine protein kinase